MSKNTFFAYIPTLVQIKLHIMMLLSSLWMSFEKQSAYKKKAVIKLLDMSKHNSQLNLGFLKRYWLPCSQTRKLLNLILQDFPVELEYIQGTIRSE